MSRRRDKVQAVLKHNEAALTITVFPRMGCGVFTAPEGPVYGDVARCLQEKERKKKITKEDVKLSASLSKKGLCFSLTLQSINTFDFRKTLK